MYVLLQWSSLELGKVPSMFHMCIIVHGVTTITVTTCEPYVVWILTAHVRTWHHVSIITMYTHVCMWRNLFLKSEHTWHRSTGILSGWMTMYFTYNSVVSHEWLCRVATPYTHGMHVHTLFQSACTAISTCTRHLMKLILTVGCRLGLHFWAY